RRRDGRVRSAVRPRCGSGHLGEADLQQAGLARPPGGSRGGHGVRPRDLLAGLRRLVRRPDRRGGGRDIGWLRADHQIPGRGTPRCGPEVLDGRRRAEHSARSAVTPQQRKRPGAERRVTMNAPDVLPARGIDADQLLVLYEQMAVIRRTEKAAHDLFMSGVVKGTTHLAAGQEAVAVGASAALRPDDYVFATYRGHHHAMARGASPEECLAELMSKATGLCKAKGGSMHLTKAAVGMLGSYAIVGSHLPMAAGAAWSARLRESDQVAVAFFGDGATNIGAFHEALNLASVWRLPVLFICENNLYMEYTPISAVTAADNPAADRAPAYRMPGEVIDGNDVVLVRDAVQEAAVRARRGDGPTLIEAQTYRHYGHSRADPAKYRPPEEVERWLKHDPLDIARARLEALGVGPQAVEVADARAARIVDEAVDAAKNAPEPEPEQAFTDLWADGGAAWRTPAVQVSARIASQQPPAEMLRPGRSESTEEPPTITYREAVAEGIAREMRRDPTVVCLGEDIGAAEGVFKTTVGLFAEFGAQRVWDTPISEQAIVGAAMGAAMTGMRP